MSFPIGTPGVPWGPEERAAWLAGRKIRRSYQDDVLGAESRLAKSHEVVRYGALDYDPGRYPLLAYRSQPGAAGRLFLFAGIDEARFKRQVVPGDALVLEATFDKGMRDVSKYTARATVDGQLACEAKLMAAMRDAPSAG